MTTFEIRSWLAPATGGCEQQVERLLAHLAELEWRPGEVAPCAHAWFTDQHALHRAISEKMPLPMPVCSKCGISKAEHIFGAPQPVEPLFGVSRHQVGRNAEEPLRTALERIVGITAECIRTYYGSENGLAGEVQMIASAALANNQCVLVHVAGKKS